MLAFETEGMAPEGIRVDLRIEDPGDCPIVDVAREADARAENVSRAVVDGTQVVEFTVLSGADDLREDLETVFESDAVTRVRHCGSSERDCACRVLSEFRCPTTDVTAENTALSFSFFTTDMETLESVIDVLRSRFESVHVTELARNHEFTGRDPATVDRARLTDRQREVLETALSMGYYETPKRANATEVAAELDIALPTVCEHLSAGQRKLLDMALESENGNSL